MTRIWSSIPSQPRLGPVEADPAENDSSPRCEDEMTSKSQAAGSRGVAERLQEPPPMQHLGWGAQDGSCRGSQRSGVENRAVYDSTVRLPTCSEVARERSSCSTPSVPLRASAACGTDLPALASLSEVPMVLRATLAFVWFRGLQIVGSGSEGRRGASCSWSYLFAVWPWLHRGQVLIASGRKSRQDKPPHSCRERPAATPLFPQKTHFG